jgi:hypothetical protein
MRHPELDAVQAKERGARSVEQGARSREKTER